MKPGIGKLIVNLGCNVAAVVVIGCSTAWGINKVCNIPYKDVLPFGLMVGSMAVVMSKMHVIDGNNR